MPAPVKISELPAISSVQPGDIVPIVDEGLTQTSRATAAQIAALGGGRPGDGMVITASLANGAVTAPKTGFTGPDKLISRTAVGAGEGVEIPCTSYARGLLAVSNAAGARQYLDALQGTESPTFTGTVTVNGGLSVSGEIAANGGITGQMRAGDGTANAPSYSFSGDTDTGIARLGGNNTLSIISGGVERLRVNADGSLSSPIVGGTALLPHFACRAWVNFWGPGASVRASGNVSSVARLQVGDYAVYFAEVMPDANYAYSGVVGNGDDGQTAPPTVRVGTTTSSFCRFSTPLHSGTQVRREDWGYVLICVFR